MPISILQVYPTPGGDRPLRGAYLDHDVHALGSTERPFVYANFLSSLDGRIALVDADSGESRVPDALTNANDWRLFQELEAQADCLITHGGYLRSLASGRLGNILQVGARRESTDLLAWRRHHGLEDQPAIVVASASLEFEIPASVRAHRQPLYIATGEQADPDRIRDWKQQGYEVLRAGRGKMVEGAPLVRALAARGFRCLFLVAGPRMLATMLRHRQLARLYMTITHQIIGGEAFHSIFPDPELGDAGNLQLESLYYDTTSPLGAGQWFARFGCVGRR